MRFRNRAVRRIAGVTILEVTAAFGLLVIVMGGVLSSTLGVQNAFLEDQAISQLRIRAQLAADRIAEVVSRALTTDAQFSPLLPATGISSHCLRFRVFTGIETGTGNPLYDDVNRIYVTGPDNGPSPCRGIIIGRGSTLAAVHAAGAGSDGFLGTSDDDTTTLTTSGDPRIELLLPDTYAPQAGDMLSLDVNPAPVGKFLTFTLRLNARGSKGNFIFTNDLVLNVQVALKQ